MARNHIFLNRNEHCRHKKTWGEKGQQAFFAQMWLTLWSTRLLGIRGKNRLQFNTRGFCLFVIFPFWWLIRNKPNMSFDGTWNQDNNRRSNAPFQKLLENITPTWMTPMWLRVHRADLQSSVEVLNTPEPPITPPMHHSKSAPIWPTSTHIPMQPPFSNPTAPTSSFIPGLSGNSSKNEWTSSTELFSVRDWDGTSIRCSPYWRSSSKRSGNVKTSWVSSLMR